MWTIRLAPGNKANKGRLQQRVVPTPDIGHALNFFKNYGSHFGLYKVRVVSVRARLCVPVCACASVRVSR